MRVYKVRYDVLICFLLAALVSFGSSKLLPAFYTMLSNRYVVADGELGGKAGDDVYVVQSIEDILSHDTFTMRVSDDSYRHTGVGLFDDKLLTNLDLPSGERIAVCINEDAMQKASDDGDYFIMPVGKVVKTELSGDSWLMKYIEIHDPLSRTDFYVDMVGKGTSTSRDFDYYDEQYTLYIKSFVAIISFFVIHIVGCKLGFFPPFIQFRRKNKN